MLVGNYDKNVSRQSATRKRHGRGGGGVKKEGRAETKEGRKGDKGRWMDEIWKNLHGSDEILILSLNWEEITRGL